VFRSEGSEPFTDGGDLEGGLEADGELVVPGRDCPDALEAVDAALDGVALLYCSGSKAGGLPPELLSYPRAGARAVPESTETSQVTCPAASARACSAVSSRFQVPSRCQRRNSPYADRQGP